MAKIDITYDINCMHYALYEELPLDSFFKFQISFLKELEVPMRAQIFCRKHGIKF
jgi:hypothetical protein